ncbi:MAG: transcriptional regulator ArgR [Kyrpidia sp.]|uniref:Transcriptional regulator (AhrC(ArgR)-arginine) n=3 Tax=Alicyclobacillaceae TaxID=186823 RepID=A0ACA8Z778_9BACL|nr:transcriptional regulator ArgR [Kyrpidia sp.]CAB3391151.1 transcriptional regulator (AhrC(ArgR)-arginine) [Kyrpidia spormannii]CAB3392063.1 transcriptional regulator (AhrC(ArgR)-arginine) [Kyrpidia spormannii]
MMKNKRLTRIRELVASRSIETQEELVQALRESGFQVTQATVSRDIKELQLIKVPTADGRYVYALPPEPAVNNEARLRRMLPESFVALDRAENLIVMKTLPGNAHAVAALVDAVGWPEVMGTIAGDDTILVICRSALQAAAVEERFHQMV